MQEPDTLFSLVILLGLALLWFFVWNTKKNMEKIKTGEHPPAGHERIVILQGACNMRDLGGYAAADGKRVLWKTLFRADDLAHLTPEDQNILAHIPITTCIDFRSAEERQQWPNKLPRTATSEIALSIDPGSISLLQKIQEGQAEQAMKELNRAFVHDFQDEYRQFFALLQAGAGPILFHCSAGKDRTGYAAALLLAALGVERRIIYDDYLLSAELVGKKYARHLTEAPYMRDALTVKPCYLAAAFETIDSAYGGLDTYLSKNLAVNTAKLRALYTA